MQEPKRDPMKRYVTVARVLEILNVSERSVRRWYKERKPPLLRSIRDAHGNVLIDLEDVERLKAIKSDLVRPLPERVETLEEYVGRLQQEVSDLKEQLAGVRDLLEAGGQGAGHAAQSGNLRVVRQSPARPAGAEKLGYPPDTMRLVDFEKKHQIPISKIKELYFERKIIVDVYERTGAQRNAREWWITPEHHRALIAFYQQQGWSCERCELCAESSDESASSA